MIAVHSVLVNRGGWPSYRQSAFMESTRTSVSNVQCSVLTTIQYSVSVHEVVDFLLLSGTAQTPKGAAEAGHALQRPWPIHPRNDRDRFPSMLVCMD